MAEQGSEPRKAILYVRVSTRGKNQEESPDNQRRRLIAYCDSMSYEWSEELIFGDYFSGTTMDRPGWSKVIQAVKDGKGNLIVATRLDRLARTDEFPAFLRNVIKKHGADIACIEQSIDTTTSHGRMILGILTLVYQQYAEEVKEKTRGVMQFLLKEGKWVWRNPFGTMVGPVKGIPVKNPETWPILLEIYERSSHGATDAEILAWLNGRGIKTVEGAAWSHPSLKRLLTNRWFLGEFRRDGQVYNLKHDCLIPLELWQGVQAGRKKQGRRGPKPTEYPFLLRGLVYCSHFEVTHPANRAEKPVPLAPTHSHGRSGQKYYYYKAQHRCSAHGKMQAIELDPLAQTFPEIPASELDGVILRKLISLGEADHSGKLLIQAEEASNTALASLRGEILALEARKRSCEKALKATQRRLADAYVEDDMNIVRSMSQRVNELTEESEQVAAETKGKQDALSIISNSSGEVEAILSRINMLESLYLAEDWNALREVLTLLIDRIDVRMDGTRIYLATLPCVRKALSLLELTAVPEKVTEPAPAGIEPAFSP